MNRRKGIQCAVSLLLAVVLKAPAASTTESIKIGGTGGALGTMRVLGEPFKKQYPNIEVVVVPGLGSRGSLDVAVTARPWKGAEKLDGAVARL